MGTYQTAPHGDTVRAERNLEFMTAAEIATEVSADVQWIVRPWIAKGAITELDGKVKSAGKTTWVTFMCRAVLDGLHFMDEPTLQTPVVYLTEQPKASFRESLARADLLDRKDLFVLFWNQKASRMSWPEIAHEAIEKAQEVGAQLLVVDTIAQFANLVGDRENNSGDALQAVKPLQLAVESGLAVLVVRHEGKRGGAVGDSGRGSSAFSGAVDVVISIHRQEGQGNNNVRVLQAVSRFDATPDRVTIELTPDGYVSLGCVRESAEEAAERAILAILPTCETDALNVEEISSRASISRSTAQRALGLPGMQERVIPLGRGVKGDPVRYYLKEIHSAQTAIPGTEKVSVASDTKAMGAYQP